MQPSSVADDILPNQSYTPLSSMGAISKTNQCVGTSGDKCRHNQRCAAKSNMSPLQLFVTRADLTRSSSHSVFSLGAHTGGKQKRQPSLPLASPPWGLHLCRNSVKHSNVYLAESIFIRPLSTNTGQQHGHPYPTQGRSKHSHPTPPPSGPVS